MAELDGPVVEGFKVVSSNDGSRGFALVSAGGSSRVSVNGEEGLAGSDASVGGSSAGLATFAFLDLAWPLRKMLQDHQIKIQFVQPRNMRIFHYPGAVLKAGN